MTSWLDIIASATSVHSKAFLARMLLAEDKYMVTDAVPPLSCFNCKHPITDAIKAYQCNKYSCMTCTDCL
jgi:hypothetical protein